MRQIFGGAALVIVGIAAFIEAHSHRPGVEARCPRHEIGEILETGSCHSYHIGLSQTAYDLLRIGAWALVIVGTLLVVTGLIWYWATQAQRHTQ